MKTVPQGLSARLDSPGLTGSRLWTVSSYNSESGTWSFSKRILQCHSEKDIWTKSAHLLSTFCFFLACTDNLLWLNSQRCFYYTCAQRRVCRNVACDFYVENNSATWIILWKDKWLLFHKLLLHLIFPRLSFWTFSVRCSYRQLEYHNVLTP